VLTTYDYLVLAAYVPFLVASGLCFRRLSTETSHYFVAGGTMPWWITGIAAWCGSFSAWTFTGAAGRAYEAGALVLAVFYSPLLGLLLLLAVTSVRFRRMRVLSWSEAVRLRYGPFTERFYAWAKLPLQVLFGGVMLDALGVFLSSFLGIDFWVVVLVVGLIVIVKGAAGGAWEVLASSFVQGLLLITVTGSTAFLVLGRPEIGGMTGLLRKVPSAHLDWTELCRLPILLGWMTAMASFKVIETNSIENSASYLMTRGERDARRMVLVPIVGALVCPLIWLVPSMAAAVMHPNLASEYPSLAHPHEAAFVSVSVQVMPQGLAGLLLCVVIGASVLGLGAQLNGGVAVFIRSVYLPAAKAIRAARRARRDAVPRSQEHGDSDVPEAHLLVASRVAVVCFGLAVISSALLVDRFRSTSLFDLTNQLCANFLIPLALPLVYGLFFERTPSWSAWSTVAVSGLASFLMGRAVSPSRVERWLEWQESLNAQEERYLLLFASGFGALVVGSAWYFFSAAFYRGDASGRREGPSPFFARLGTPLPPPSRSELRDIESSVMRTIGTLCLLCGAFTLLLTFLPNSPTGRSCILFCGSVVLLAGLLVRGRARRVAAELVPIQEAPPQPSTGDAPRREPTRWSSS
jgi:Na+/proline symporter